MSTSPQAALTARQSALLVRSTQLRGAVGQDATVLRRPMAFADQLHTGWAWFRAHPEWPIGVAVALLVIRPKRAIAMGLRAWWLWRTVQRVRQQVAMLT